MTLLSRLRKLIWTLRDGSQRLQRIQEALGRIERRQIALTPTTNFSEAEFRVFSQWGEDGLIQYLTARVPMPNKVFVEFGVENYIESNTRYLAINDCWSGLVMDGSAENIDFIQHDPISWACDVKSVCAFITRENINELLELNGIQGDIGLLSVDIDGNDYWVWEAIQRVSPRIVICEYNSLFGPVARVTVPYDPAFIRDKAHHSKVYYGASIAALETLGRSKGYTLVGGNSAGNNVFFVRNDLMDAFRPVSACEAYRQARFREFHDEYGHLTCDNFESQLAKIDDLVVFDIDHQISVKIGDLPRSGSANV
ncbi:MAG: hypothetical protein P4K83_11470 [Terracidiphilus sp.]|nr:hypothetical protein [Terracidiphilus sp.]